MCKDRRNEKAYGRNRVKLDVVTVQSIEKERKEINLLKKWVLAKL